VARDIAGLAPGTRVFTKRSRYVVGRGGRVTATTRRSDNVLVRRIYRNGVRERTLVRRLTKESGTPPPGTETRLLRRVLRRWIEPGDLRASLMGLSDGVASTFGLVVATTAMGGEGGQGAEMTASVVMLAGLGAMISGASSMASGEYSSVGYEQEQVAGLARKRVQAALNGDLGRPLRRAVRRAAAEAGVSERRADDIVRALRRAPHTLEQYASELALVSSMAPARSAARSSFVSFLIGSAVPMTPLLLGMTDTPAVAAAGLLSVSTLLGVGATLARLSGVSSARSRGRLAAAASLGAGVSWAVGNVLGWLL